MEVQIPEESTLPAEGPTGSCHVFELTSDALSTFACALGLAPSIALVSLARAISVSPEWKAAPNARLIVRTTPRPILGVLGDLSPEQEAWLAYQTRSLDAVCRRMRYVSSAQAVKDCARLAGLLRQELGDQISDARFVAIPRGGYLVLDQLARRLSLKQAQLSLDESAELVVVVDDCILTGARFASFLSSCPGSRLIFATLYSPNSVRAAIEADEPRIASCLSAADLASFPIDEHLAWRSVPGKRYQLERTEHLVFPWNEPERSLWNPTFERWESAWRIVPPELCSKNCPAPGQKPVPVHVQPEGVGPLRPSRHALFADLAGRISLWNMETHRGFVLRGAGSDIWNSLVRYGDLEEVAARLAQEYDTPEERLRSDIFCFVNELIGCGLLEEET